MGGSAPSCVPPRGASDRFFRRPCRFGQGTINVAAHSAVLPKIGALCLAYDIELSFFHVPADCNAADPYSRVPAPRKKANKVVRGNSWFLEFSTVALTFLRPLSALPRSLRPAFSHCAGKVLLVHEGRRTARSSIYTALAVDAFRGSWRPVALLTPGRHCFVLRGGATSHALLASRTRTCTTAPISSPTLRATRKRGTTRGRKVLHVALLLRRRSCRALQMEKH